MGKPIVINSKVIWKSQLIVICKILHHVFIETCNHLHGCSRRRKQLLKKKKHKFDNYIEIFMRYTKIYKSIITCNRVANAVKFIIIIIIIIIINNVSRHNVNTTWKKYVEQFIIFFF